MRQWRQAIDCAPDGTPRWTSVFAGTGMAQILRLKGKGRPAVGEVAAMR